MDTKFQGAAIGSASATQLEFSLVADAGHNRAYIYMYNTYKHTCIFTFLNA